MAAPDATLDDLTARVMAIVVRSARLPPARVTPESTFADLGLDSLDAINIAFTIEDEFQVAIPEEMLRSVTGVREVVEGLRALLAPGAGAPGDA